MLVTIKFCCEYKKLFFEEFFSVTKTYFFKKISEDLIWRMAIHQNFGGYLI